MKKITFYIITACMLLVVQPLMAKDGGVVTTTNIVIPKAEESVQAHTLLLRLNEIKTMDKSNLNAKQKQSLRLEVRAIKHKLNEMGDGIYLSVGAVIIILLLVIILL